MTEKLRLSKKINKVKTSSAMPILAVISGGLVGYAAQHEIAWLLGMSLILGVMSLFGTLFYALEGAYQE